MKSIIAMLFPQTAGFTAFGPSKRTVDTALLGLNKAIEELKAVQALEEAEAQKQAQAIIDAQAAKEKAETEAARASRIVGRIENLLK